MKPIYLSFAGLNSYKEEQHVDFTYLFGAGVFGIFGPTGSGKSTILDALTLALYGSVERASHRTQGILNQYSNQVSVSFTFELENAQARRRFRVERTFKQGKTPGSVEGKQARLVEVGCNAEPGREDILHILAENGTNVTTYIIDLLGLELADFTRAVVLPQGKFAEFLTLQGGERRSMLQRLFGLELYGDRLIKQLRLEQQENENEIKLLKAKQAEIGDASPEAVERAKQQMVEVQQQQNAVIAELAGLEKEHAQWAQVWSLQNEMAEVKQQLVALDAQAEQMQSLEERLTLAQRAELIRPMLVAYHAAEQEATEAQNAVCTAEQRLTVMTASLNAAQTERAQAERLWTQESPGLYAHQAHLNRAVDLEKQLVQLQNQQQQARQTLEKTRTKTEEVRTATQRAQSEADQAAGKLEQVRTQISERTVDPERRTQVNAATAALKRWQEAQKQEQAELREYQGAVAAFDKAQQQEQAAKAVVEDAQAAIDELQKRRVEHTHARPWDEEELAFRRTSHQNDERIAYQIKTLLPNLELAAQDLAESKAKLQVLEKEREQTRLARELAEEAQVQAKQELAQAESALQAALHADMAATLAKQVTQGHPCPVCGSEDHPRLAVSVQTEQLQALEQAVKACRERLQKVEATLTTKVASYSQKQAEYDLVAKRIEPAQSTAEKLQTQLTELRQQLPKTWQELNPSELPQVVAQAAKDLTERENAYKKWQQKEKDLEKEERTLTAQLTTADKELTRLTSTQQATQLQVEQSDKRLKSAQKQTQELRQELDQARSELTLEDIEPTAAQYERWDREVTALRKEETHWTDQEKQAKLRWEQGRAQLRQLEVDLAVQEEQAHALRQQADALQAEIFAVTGGKTSAADALIAVNERLQQLDKARTHAQEREQQANQEQQAALQTHTSARERLSIAQKRVTDTEQLLTAALQEHHFASATDAQAALLSQIDRDALQTKIRDYQEALKKWRQEESRLQHALAGRSLSQADWDARQKQLEDKRAQRDAALQAYAVAEKGYKELVDRHERWLQLAKDDAALSNRKTYLADLASLLRGNALVDFLAERQLQQVAFDASTFLGKLTAYRYAIEVGSDGSFIIRDDVNGGYRRAVHTLSGGETFLTSLALALALSSQIQLQGKYPLEFFFLDEGFGSLDQELLDVAMTALERLHLNRLHVGIISHVPELRNRILRRLLVEAAAPGEHGSRIVADVS
jgi:exonuclease SbcC